MSFEDVKRSSFDKHSHEQLYDGIADVSSLFFPLYSVGLYVSHTRELNYRPPSTTPALTLNPLTLKSDPR